MKFNLNQIVKVRLTDKGKDIWYHRYDDIPTIKPSYPKVDSDGYTEMQLHQFMNIFGKYMVIGFDNVCDMEIILLEEK